MAQKRTFRFACHLAAHALALAFYSAAAQAQTNSLGMPGHSAVPIARPYADGDLSLMLNLSDSRRLGGLTFQITPRLTGAFRYGRIDLDGSVIYDRSFDLQYQFLNEVPGRPGLAIGLRDFIGTGLLSSEYIVATARLKPTVTASLGLGWGELGAAADFPAIFSATRPEWSGLGGEPGVDQWFRGPAAVFAGLNWQINQQLSLGLDYTGADDDEVSGPGLVSVSASYRARSGLTVSVVADDAGQFNFGLEYRFNPGSAVISRGTFVPPAVAVSEPGDPAPALRAEGIQLLGIDVQGETARLRLENRRYGSTALMLGRAARVLVASLPPTVSTYNIEPVGPGPASVRVTMKRSDLLAADGGTRLAGLPLDAFTLSPAEPWTADWERDPHALTGGVRPYVAFSLFDPDSPLRGDLGLEAFGLWRITPGLHLDSTMRVRILGNRDESDRVSDSVLPPVRSDAVRYAQEGEVTLPRLALTQAGTLGGDIYERVSIGLLEEMFAGVAGEVLWKPVDSRLAIGLEMAHVWQRDPGVGLEFSQYGYDATTGLLSFYYALTPEFDMRVDVGQYLAGDQGGTLAAERRFANGWKVGAYATLTDVSFKDFGEGSFDKGITLTVPFDWLLGKPTMQRADITLQPVLRDGGARLDLPNRLYETVRPTHRNDLTRSWIRFAD